MLRGVICTEDVWNDVACANLASREFVFFFFSGAGNERVARLAFFFAR